MKLSKNKILILLANKGLNISDLAELYGCTRARIYTILDCNTVRTATAGRIAKVLNVNVTDILEDSERS